MPLAASLRHAIGCFGVMPLAASRRHAIGQLAALCHWPFLGGWHDAASRRAKRAAPRRTSCGPAAGTAFACVRTPPGSPPFLSLLACTNPTRSTMTSPMNRTRMRLVRVHPPPPATGTSFIFHLLTRTYGSTRAEHGAHDWTSASDAMNILVERDDYPC